MQDPTFQTNGPLSGLVVLDLTRVLAGPFCTLLLAEQGARVIKIEQPQTGDDARQFGPFVNGQSAYFMSLNRGKESIALNLKDNEDDRKIFDSLLAKADILVENYRPGTMKRWGYDWESLKTRYPRLIMASISGFGQTGPYASRPAYDLVVQAMGGLMSITGHPHTPPTRVGSSMGDITAALFASNGILSALHHRHQTGKGSYIDISMLDCQVAILENAIARTTTTQQAPSPLGARHPSITPFDAFATRDGHIVIACGNDALFAKLCETLGVPEWTNDPMWDTNAKRTQHADALKQQIESILRDKPTTEWLVLLQKQAIPCGPINDIEDILRDPHVHSRNMLVQTNDPRAGSITMAGNPVKIEGFPDPLTRPSAPQLDQNRKDILHSLDASSWVPLK